LTARNVFGEDLIQERYFDDIDEYDARDYLDNKYETRDVSKRLDSLGRPLPDLERLKHIRPRPKVVRPPNKWSSIRESKSKRELLDARDYLNSEYEARDEQTHSGVKARRRPTRLEILRGQGGGPNKPSRRVSTRELLEDILDARERSDKARKARRRRRTKPRRGDRKGEKPQAGDVGTMSRAAVQQRSLEIDDLE
jgi:hypothetical protein